jgi:hypothetical protein
MDDLTLEEVEDCIRLRQDRLGLHDWDIEVKVKRIKPRTVGMQCCRSAQYDRAVINVNDWVLTNTPPRSWHDGRKMTWTEHCIHELLHCHIDPLDRWQHRLHGYVQNDVWRQVACAYDDEEEHVVDRLARALIQIKCTHGKS